MDAVAAIVAQWQRERPDLDATPLLVVGRIGRLAAQLDDLLRPPFAQAGMRPGDFDVLAALRRAGAPYARTPGELAEAMLVTNGAATKRIDRLEAQGLVRRETSPDDGRSRVVSLTPDGVALVDRLMPVHLANEARILAALSPAQRSRLEDLLGALAVAVEESLVPLN